MTTDEPPEPAEQREEPPVMPTADEADASRRRDYPDERPPMVQYAFGVWVLAGILGVVNSVIMLANKQVFVDEAVKQNHTPGVTNDKIASGAVTLLWMFLLATITFAVLFALFAYKAQQRERRARLMLTILCLITVAFYLLLLRVYLGPLVAALALGGTVLLYLPRSNYFFRPGALPT